MPYEERGEATSLYISYKVYMIITQTRCIIALLLAVISEESRTDHSRTNPVIHVSWESCNRTECLQSSLFCIAMDWEADVQERSPCFKWGTLKLKWDLVLITWEKKKKKDETQIELFGHNV